MAYNFDDFLIRTWRGQTVFRQGDINRLDNFSLDKVRDLIDFLEQKKNVTFVNAANLRKARILLRKMKTLKFQFPVDWFISLGQVLSLVKALVEEYFRRTSGGRNVRNEDS